MRIRTNNFFLFTILWIRRRRMRRDYPIKTIRPKSGKYLSSNTRDRSAKRKRRRYCHDRTLTDGFRGSAAHKMQPFFPRHRKLFILPRAAVHSRCCIRSRAIDVLLSTSPTWYLIKIAYDISIASDCIQIRTIPCQYNCLYLYFAHPKDIYLIIYLFVSLNWDKELKF